MKLILSIVIVCVAAAVNAATPTPTATVTPTATATASPTPTNTPTPTPTPYQGSEPITVNTATGAVKQTSSHTGTITKPFDFSAVDVRIVPRVTYITSAAQPTINTDQTDVVAITALATAITSMSNNLSGSPHDFQSLVVRIVDNGSPQSITWGPAFVSSQATLPTTTVSGKITTVGLKFNMVLDQWRCLAVDQQP